MRISTNQMFDSGIRGILTGQAKSLQIQQQISSEKKVNSPSDDPVAASQIDLMKKRINFTERLQLNRQNVDGMLRYEEGILSNMANVMQRIRELQVASGNSALSENDRKGMAIEAKNLLQELQSLANTQDSNGDYIFSGSKTTTEAISQDITGQYIYKKA